MIGKAVTILAYCGAVWALKHYHGWDAALPVLVACPFGWAVAWIWNNLAMKARKRQGTH